MLSAKHLFFLLLIAGVAFEIVADLLLKKWSMQNKPLLLGLGIVLYVASTFFWAYSLRYEALSKAVVIFTVLNLIAVVLIGVLLFNENLSLTNKLGIGLGVLSVILIEL